MLDLAHKQQALIDRLYYNKKTGSTSPKRRNRADGYRMNKLHNHLIKKSLGKGPFGQVRMYQTCSGKGTWADPYGLDTINKRESRKRLHKRTASVEGYMRN
jgi:hypothetical protein